MLQNQMYRNVEFDCSDGIYAANTHGYLSKSWQFVNWGPKDNSARTKRETNLHFSCLYSNGQFLGFRLEKFGIKVSNLSGSQS